MNDTNGVNIEQMFLHAMRPIGGVRPEEIDPTIIGKSVADLYFKSERTIAEVKTLLEDPISKIDFHTKYTLMFERWVHEKKVPPQSGRRIKIETDKLPLECSREFLDAICVALKTHVSKANNQIKQTKEHLDISDAKGLLVICNTANSVLGPSVLLYGLNRALGDQHSSIDWLIYMTYMNPVMIPNGPGPTELFTHSTREGHSKMPKEFAVRIQNAWMSYVSRDGAVIEISGTAADLKNATHIDRRKK